MKRQIVTFEQLESRSLLSVVAAADPAPSGAGIKLLATAQTAVAGVSPLAGAFNVAGTFTRPFGNPDAGAQYKFTGTGKTKALGSFSLTGHLQLPGFIASARASGRFTVTTSHGTLTLSIHGPQQTPGSLPSFVSYSIVKGTGSYLHSAGKGQITLSASETTHKFVFRFNQTV